MQSGSLRMGVGVGVGLAVAGAAFWTWRRQQLLESVLVSLINSLCSLTIRHSLLMTISVSDTFFFVLQFQLLHVNTFAMKLWIQHNKWTTFIYLYLTNRVIKWIACDLHQLGGGGPGGGADDVPHQEWGGLQGAGGQGHQLWSGCGRRCW